MNILKIKKILNKTELTKEEKRKIMIIGSIEWVLNCWIFPLRMIILPIWLLCYFFGILFTKVSEILYNFNSYLRDNFEITLGHKELKQKMYNEIKKINNRTIKKEDIKE